VWNNYHAACCRYRELQADSTARSKRSWTLKPAVRVKKPKGMWTSYSTLLPAMQRADI
jgi:hypothetical protein